MRLIKKHKNRKYYDSSVHRYTNLSEIADLATCSKMSIVDEEGRDVTLETLLMALASKKVNASTVISVMNEYV